MPYSVPMPKQQFLPLFKNTSSRGKKKKLHSSKSITSTSWPLLNNSIRQLSQGSVFASSHPARCKTNRKDFSHCPKLRVSLPRLEYLSTPHPRTVLLPFNLVSLPHERNKKLPLLIAIKPENEKTERDRFMRANFNYNPYFAYRCPADEQIMERYNTPSDQYLDIAVQILENAIAHFGSYEEFEDQTGGHLLSRSQTLFLVRRYLKKEHLESEIQVNLSEDLLSQGSLTHNKGQPQLNVRVINQREYWCEGLLRHELGTHYLRNCNDQFQPWHTWQQRRDLCMQHFNPTEEGLASLHSVLISPFPFLWRAALLYYVTFKAARLSFKDLFMDLGKFLKCPSVRWDYCVRAKRGQVNTAEPGTFCKDQVYLDGALQLLKRRYTLNFDLLMRLGKVAHSDVERLTEHCQLNNTRVPSFMSNLKKYRQQLDHIVACNGITEEILSYVE